jgi:hypothetical protein
MFDRLLVKPMALDICTALAEVGGGDRDFWSGQVRELRGHREGRRAWPERQARLSWWTDHEGRRHFRVMDEAPPTGHESFPPIADLYPDVCIRRGLGDERPSWVLLCGCGTVLPADAPAGWMGPCCAACHGLAPDARPRHGRILDLGEAAGVEPLVAGFAVAEHHGDTGRLRFLDSEGVTVEVREGIRVDPPFAVSPDLWHLVSVGARRLRVRSLVTGDLLLDQPQEEADSVGFSPDGTAVAVIGPKRSVLYDFNRDTGGMTPRHTERMGPPGIDECFQQAAWSPDGRTLALATAEKLRAERDGLKLPFEEPASYFSRGLSFVVNLLQDRDYWKRAAAGKMKVPRVWFTSNEDLWCILAAASESLHPELPNLALSRWRWERDAWKKVGESPIDGLTTSRFRTSGRWLAATRQFVEIMDLETGRRVGSVGWWSGGVTREPRFTADGRSMIVPRKGRILVVPWAVLLSKPA